MNFSIWALLQVLGSLAFFIFGMKTMSDGIQRAAGSQMRNILRTMTKNRYLGVLTGFLITALVQSSSATTVMTVSFVNAGLLSLVESAGIMMGANVGTTLTGWIISVLGFKIKLGAYSIPMFAFGVPMLFSNRAKVKYWGEFILGFAILFLGLSMLKEAVPDLKGNPDALAWLGGFADKGFLSRVFFVLIGAVVTVIIQSSSAAMAITLTMVAQGWLPLDIAAAMVLGENIGTTITAEIASLVGNTSAKRSARIHSMFNIIGVTWMILLLPLILPKLIDVMNGFGIQDNPTILAAFHTVFNVTNVLLLLAFVPFLVKTAILTVKGTEEDKEEFRLKFINTATRTPELATVELQRETGHYGEIVSRMLGFTKQLINSIEPKEQKKLLKKFKKYEKISDRMEIEITQYITSLSNEEITPRTSIKLRSILNICNDLERMADIFYQISKTLELKIDQKIYFLPEQRENLNLFLDKLENAFNNMVGNLNKDRYIQVNLESAKEHEKGINKLRNQLREEHLNRLGDSDYNIRAGMMYDNIYNSMEKIGDHIINVTEAIVGEI